MASADPIPLVVPKKSPWGAPKKPAVTVSLSDIQREEQTSVDAKLATKLQIAEEAHTIAHYPTPAPLPTSEQFPQASAIDDSELAARLQEEENRLAGVSGPSLETSDELLAKALQSEFDAEHDYEISAREKKANLFTHRLGLIFCTSCNGCFGFFFFWYF